MRSSIVFAVTILGQSKIVLKMKLKALILKNIIVVQTEGPFEQLFLKGLKNPPMFLQG